MHRDAEQLKTAEEPISVKLLASLAISLLIILGGMFWTYRIWTDTNQKFHELAHAREYEDGLKSRVNHREARLK